MALPTVRIIPTPLERSARAKTVNVSTAPHPQAQWKQYLQATGPAFGPAGNNQYPEFAAGLTGAGPFRNGLPTIYIAGFVGPV
jgi:hypothetical protein